MAVCVLTVVVMALEEELASGWHGSVLQGLRVYAYEEVTVHLASPCLHWHDEQNLNLYLAGL